MHADVCNSVDYWFVRKGNVHIPSVFTPGAPGVYWYTAGVNFRAYVAWLIGVVLVVHGVANALNPGSLNQASTDIYNMGFILSSLGGGVSYYVICLIWAPRIYPLKHESEPITWERTATAEGFFSDDPNVPDYINMNGDNDRSAITSTAADDSSSSKELVGEDLSGEKDRKTGAGANVIEV